MTVPRRASSLHGLLFLSGLCGLGFQVVWTRWFGFSLGHEMAGVMGVVGAFFLGLALGAWAFDGRIARSRRPGLWYVGLEVAIGAWALATLLLLPRVDELAAGWLGPAPSPLLHGLVATLLPAALLFPATMAMGATLPAMERFAASRHGDGKARLIGGLYAANTAGAMVGTLGITFLVLPALGFRSTTMTLALLNFACAAAGLALGAREPVELDEAAGAPEPSAEAVGPWGSALFATGFLGIAFETIGIRMLTQILENTIYTFAVVLSVYLAGTALGAAIYQRWLKNRPARETSATLLSILSVCCLAGIGCLSFARPIHMAIGEERGFGAAILSEGVLGAILFFAPAIAMGATFAALAQAYREQHGRSGRGLGRAFAINTLGSALAPSLCGWLLVPAIGLQWAIVAVAVGYLLLAWLLGGARSIGVLSTCLILLGWIGSSNSSLVALDQGEEVLSRQDGAMATVTVTKRPRGIRTLRVDNHFRMGGTQSAFLERRQGAIPLLLHPDPKRELFLGLGTGTTLSSVKMFDDVEADGVELVREVIDVLPMFTSVNLDVAGHPDVTLTAADARRFVRGSGREYDVIVADLFQPARDGAGTLYTVEHFRAVRNALRDGGLFCQWLPLYQMDTETSATIVASFLEAFPDSQAFLGGFSPEAPAMGLVGSTGPLRVDAAALDARMNAEPLHSGLVELAMTDPIDVLGCRVAGTAALAVWAGTTTSVRNTDDRPVVMFEAPHFVYRQRGRPWETLIDWLAGLDASPASELAMSSEVAGQVDAYVSARDEYLRGRVAYAEGREEDALDHYVASVARSKDFTVGYQQVTNIANVPMRTSRAKLLEAVKEIARLRPDLGDLRELQWQLRE
ncbi:MAG: fused MFS/spermidine synthase [Planctomycetota bacterium]